MKEWAVYVEGAYVGTVHETSESTARCAALCKYDIPGDAEFSVSRIS